MQLTVQQFRTEFILLVIVLFGAAIMYPGEPKHSKGKTVLFFAAPGIFLVLLSAWLSWGGVVPAWGPTLLSPIELLLWIDLGLACLLVVWSGGSFASPFSPLFFTLPTFALQLEQGWGFLQWYFVGIIACFLVTLRTSPIKKFLR